MVDTALRRYGHVPNVIGHSIGIRGPHPWIDASAYGVRADNTTDDTAALQAALDAASTAGTEVMLPRGRIRITSTVTMSKSGVRLRGPWTGKQVFPATGQNDGTVIRWDGADGGTMLYVSAGGGAATSIHGVGIENVILDGDDSAGTGLLLETAQGVTIRNVVVRHCTTFGIKGGVLNSAPLDGINLFYRSDFENCVIAVSGSATGLRLTGSTNVIGGENSSFINVRGLHVTHKNGPAILIDDADECGFHDVGISRISGGTGIGVDLSGGNNATASPNKGGARYITFYNLWPGQGGVTSRATGFDAPAVNNTVYGYCLEDAPPLPTVEDGSTLAWFAGNQLFTGFHRDARRELFLADDFMANHGLSSANTGDLDWNTSLTGAGNTARIAGEADHPGILRLSTGATINSLSAVHLTVNGTGLLLPAEMFDTTWIVRLNTNDTNTLARIGLVPTANSNPDNNGIYIEKLAADTSWFGVTRSAASQTRTAALATIDTNWIRFRVRRKNATTIGFTVNDETEVLATATIPTAAMQPFFHIRNAAAADKTIDVDYFSLLVQGLSR